MDGAAASGGASVKAGLRDALEASGALPPIKAQLRAAVFHAIEGTAGGSPSAAGRPAPSPEALIAHELIREYLIYMGMDHTLSVFTAEANLAPASVPRKLLASTVGLAGATPTVPLLCAMVAEGADQCE